MAMIIPSLPMADQARLITLTTYTLPFGISRIRAWEACRARAGITRKMRSLTPARFTQQAGKPRLPEFESDTLKDRHEEAVRFIPLGPRANEALLRG